VIEFATCVLETAKKPAPKPPKPEPKARLGPSDETLPANAEPASGQAGSGEDAGADGASAGSPEISAETESVPSPELEPIAPDSGAAPASEAPSGSTESSS
jgi:hypothetical protein